MSMTGLLNALEDTSLGAAVRGDFGWEWLFPSIEALHVMSLTLVFGSIVMLDLRLIGLAERDSAVSKLSREVLPYTWVAFIGAALTGSMMFISKAHVYFYNLQFQLKFLCMFLAGLNMAVFHLGAYRHVRDWDRQQPPPRAARLAGALSIMLWIGVVFLGRWIGFTT